ncbi:MAG: type III-B CRISPR-associated protein Cas10/Cmr2 [Leptolyngbya sp. SIO1E4]|nr:type III-B CRISPR-associated protein Cas10/Cmr2 [Leptolyngbya sp. SIO1E4]
MREALQVGKQVPEKVRSYVEQVQKLDKLDYPKTLEALKTLQADNQTLWNAKIGLAYGGATKIKQYVFEAPKLQDIRGASALLDRINLIDLPAFFHGEESERFEQCQQFPEYCQQVRDDWLELEQNFQGLSQALIPELIIYSTGGNILAFCPVAYVQVLADAIEKRYTHETLIANSCAVGQPFRFLELKFGLLKNPIDQTPWLEWYRENANHYLVEASFGKATENLTNQFKERKSFNELVRQLAVRFNQRRSGDDRFSSERSSRRYPPMFEAHPYGRRDTNEKRSAVRQIDSLPNQPWFSDVEARKRISGQKAKRDNQNTSWYDANTRHWLGWEPGEFQSWVTRYERFLGKHPALSAQYNPQNRQLQENKKEARSLREIGNASQGFVAYIYADGNSMGQYIQTIKTAEAYKAFSEAVSIATEHAVYYALAEHLAPHRLHGLEDPDNKHRNGDWIHPFEILTIGGDDVMLMVPANKALAIAKTLSEQFENLLMAQNSEFSEPQQFSRESLKVIHRYHPANAAKPIACQLSMSAGVLITAQDTPIYYAEDLTNQLLKSAKKHAKKLKKEYGYLGGTIDFLVMKAVTMLSSQVSEFRKSGLEFGERPKLKLYSAPYTLHEIGGLLETAEALKQAEFPRSQLYQIRDLLQRGKRTAMLNYRYFWSRLSNKDAKAELKEKFEDAWCQAKTNDGNLVPWSFVTPTEEERRSPDYVPTYETIWRELIDLYPFIDEVTARSESETSASLEV